MGWTCGKHDREQKCIKRSGRPLERPKHGYEVNTKWILK